MGGVSCLVHPDSVPFMLLFLLHALSVIDLYNPGV